ncbi:hypothetical protein ACU4GI_47570 (plasmid) [Cupriavidus basilensis]
MTTPHTPDEPCVEPVIVQPPPLATTTEERGATDLIGSRQIVDEDPIEHIAVLGYN